MAHFGLAAFQSRAELVFTSYFAPMHMSTTRHASREFEENSTSNSPLVNTRYQIHELVSTRTHKWVRVRVQMWLERSIITTENQLQKAECRQKQELATTKDKSLNVDRWKSWWLNKISLLCSWTKIHYKKMEGGAWGVHICKYIGKAYNSLNKFVNNYCLNI